LILDIEGIERLIKQYAKEVRNIRMDIFRMTWYMRGGVTATEAYMTSYEERQIINEIITGNLETAKKTNQPFW
jgi:hypothetical protein